ncbi:hypothetical protein [Phreatobacter oligotrophus]|uniref:Uncharacterized protein n=1 Tax=Phreatobacter oligotrophus TaxID=1122261 RepID=A0A2T4Z248_9HYPH|nr:hypothetical protein [Phreatobacter oligotrophus]PTM54857.1 hypothetical protein C8P69_1055 [Phreatobacter oligotrophus]
MPRNEMWNWEHLDNCRRATLGFCGCGDWIYPALDIFAARAQQGAKIEVKRSYIISQAPNVPPRESICFKMIGDAGVVTETLIEVAGLMKEHSVL